MDNTIKNERGEFRMATGRGVSAFRFKVIINGLRLKEKTGLEPGRGYSILSVAKRETGLKTNKIPVLIAALEKLMEAEIAACTVITDGVVITTPEEGQ